MRIISFKEVAIFWLLILPAILMGIFGYQSIVNFISHPFYSYFLGLISGIIVFFVFLLVTYRIYIWAFPFDIGDIPVGDKSETRWMIYSLFWLIFFYPITLNKWIPVPFSGFLYRCFGAKIGPLSYFSSVIYDPHLVTVGHHVLGGAQSLIIPHATEGERLGHYPIKIGNHVTIGANSIILAGVTIEDHVIVGAGTVIKKGSHLKTGEVWGGNPARCLKVIKPEA